MTILARALSDKRSDAAGLEPVFDFFIGVIPLSNALKHRDIVWCVLDFKDFSIHPEEFLGGEECRPSVSAREWMLLNQTFKKHYGLVKNVSIVGFAGIKNLLEPRPCHENGFVGLFGADNAEPKNVERFDFFDREVFEIRHLRILPVIVFKFCD
ncbi:MAG: hypothetical protein V1784_04720 [bacterium]